VTLLRSAGLAALLASGCGAAAPPGPEPAESFPRSQGVCVSRNTIRSWRPLDNSRFLLFADREYQVELLYRCDSLRFTETIEFLSRDTQVCDYRGDEIRTDREDCPIGAIRSVESIESNPER